MIGSPPAMIDARRQGQYRIVFAIAAAYNVLLGLSIAVWPFAFFDAFGLARPEYPGIWQCLGMVLGLYGILYAHAARRLDAAGPIILVGLIGKILGPIGWLLSVSRGEWPVRTATLIFLNDLIWWIPFSLFLLEGRRIAERIRRAAPLFCAAINLVASGFLALVLRGGTELQPDMTARAAFIADHLLLWRIGWLSWVLSASTLIGFYAWWAARSPAPRLALLGFAFGACGLFFDATAESIFVAWLPDRMDLARTATLLSGAAANGLYCVGGVCLTWSFGGTLSPWLRRWAWAIWIAGFGLTAAAISGHVPSLVATTAVVMALSVPFFVVVWVIGRRLP